MNTDTHLESIADFANDIEATILDFARDSDWLHKWATEYEVRIWRCVSDPDAYRAEILLGGGGPTTWIEIDSRWNHATLHHSWGCDRSGEPLTKWTLRESTTEILKSLIEGMF